MLRREIFNMFFGTTVNRPLSEEQVSVIDTPPYLRTESITPSVQEFHHLALNTNIPLVISTDYAFSMSWLPIAATEATGLRFYLQKAEANIETDGIALGLHSDGYLYIGTVEDKRRLSPEQLKGEIQLKLDVIPQTGGSTHARLILTDAGGLTLAMVKTMNYATSDWQALLIISAQGMKCLRIEGNTLNKI